MTERNTQEVTTTVTKDRDSFLISQLLTGNYYFKNTILGFVAMVEHRSTFSDGEVTTKFVKADMSDLFYLKLVANPSKVNVND